jgi:hypothetical protein
VEAQFQTALDRLVETHTVDAKPQAANIDVANVKDNKDCLEEQDPETMSHHTSNNEAGGDIISSGPQLFQIRANKVENQEGYPTKIFTDTGDKQNERHGKMMTDTTYIQEEITTKISANKTNNQEESSTKIWSTGVQNEESKTKEHLESWQSKLFANTANAATIMERYPTHQHYRRYVSHVS